MPSDFSTSAKSARELIAVPELSMGSIRARAGAARARERARTAIIGIVLAVGALGAGVVGAKVYDGIRVWLTGDRAAVIVRSFVMVRQPTTSDVQTAVAHATFPVVFPVGLPAGTRINRMFFSPADRPTVIQVDYRNERTNVEWGFTLLDSATVNTDESLLPGGSARPKFGSVDQWRIGGEIVMTPGKEVASSDVDRIKAAMLKTTPSDSLAATETMLPKLIVLGGTVRLSIAEQLAADDDRSVLLDWQYVRSIARLVKQGEPILDSRSTGVRNIPYMNGKPDYGSKQVKVSWSKSVAVSAGGVRAIDALLRSPGVGVDRNNCRCEILYNQPNRSTYWIWTIPMAAIGPVRKYAVDARTFAVTPAT